MRAWVATVVAVVSLGCGLLPKPQPSVQDQWAQQGGVRLVLDVPSTCDRAKVMSVLEERMVATVTNGWFPTHSPLTLNVVAPTFDVHTLLRRGEIRFMPVLNEQPDVIADPPRGWLAATDGTTFYEVDRSRALGHEHIERVERGLNSGLPVAEVFLDAEGSAVFEQLTTEFTGQKLAITVDDVVVSAPVVYEPISGGRVHISGGYTTPTGLVEILGTPPLPCDVTVVSETAI